MADETIVHIGENSPEHVAYRLFRDICGVESRDLYAHGDNPADRAWILHTYSQCIRTVTKAAKVAAILEDTPQ